MQQATPSSSDPLHTDHSAPNAGPWWRDAVVYQIYIRSFADGNGDGIGDIAGLRSRLPYLHRLGIEAIWITPWYLSPQSDHGYDVTSYFVIDPLFGTVDDAEALFADAHALGIRVIVDIVPKHTSNEHPWFKAALAGAQGGRERALYYFRRGRGPDGSAPPNNWPSSFGGPAWTCTGIGSNTPGEWYLHIHAPEQPDLNWADARVGQAFEEVLRFWFDRGVDGFRIDVARGLFKDPALPDLPDGPVPDGHHPYQDREEVHSVYRRWREMAGGYDGERMFVAEVWAEPQRLARYLRPDELHTAFNFDFLLCPWDAASFRRVIDATLGALKAVGAPATWVLSNHDFVRHPNRYGRPMQPWSSAMGWMGEGALDLSAGLRRARAAALLSLALPGGAYIYQGEELGLPEVEDLPKSVLQDPAYFRSGGVQRGRDGCRVPLPWTGREPPFGFGPEGSVSWLPQPTDWTALTAEAQERNPSSMLSLYCQALAIRRAHPALGDGEMRWLDHGTEVLTFSRDPGFMCVVNLSSRAISLPPSAHVLLSSDVITDLLLPVDSSAWLAVPE